MPRVVAVSLEHKQKYLQCMIFSLLFPFGKKGITMASDNAETRTEVMDEKPPVSSPI